MRGILESVVANGSGSNGQIEGYRVGGKTGTAQMYENGKIVEGQVISSFICCAPADAPEYAVLFIVYEPKVAVTFGSVVAAPFAKDIMEQCLKYAGIPAAEVTEEEQATVPVPSIIGMTTEQAQEAMKQAGLYLDCEAHESVITAQSPIEGTRVKKGSTVAAVTSETSADVTQGDEVPDVVGKTVLDAYNTLKDAGLNMKIQEESHGNTVISSQDPAAGSTYNAGDTVTVTLGPAEPQTED